MDPIFDFCFNVSVSGMEFLILRFALSACLAPFTLFLCIWLSSIQGKTLMEYCAF